MGSIFKKTVTKPLPPGAEVFTRGGKRYARWTDRKGKTRTAPVKQDNDGAERITVESKTYVAKFKDGSGATVEISTGCRDRSAAQSVLADHERYAEKVRAGIMTPAESAARNHAHVPMQEHIESFAAFMRSKGDTLDHCVKTQRYLERMIEACGFRHLRDLDRSAFEKWLQLNAKTKTDGKQGQSALVRNGFRVAAVSFGRWLVRDRRLFANPFDGMSRANERTDARRPRRALTESELTTLIQTALTRPLHDRIAKNRSDAANLSATTRRKFEMLGLERAMAYKVMALTGLRVNEVATLTIGDLSLTTTPAFVSLNARHAKNRKAARVALRADLAADLGEYLARRLEWQQSGNSGGPVPIRMLPSARVFNHVPTVKVFDRDIMAAGIPKRDEHGHTIDLHSLRHSFATMLGRSGASVAVTQTALRHSDPRLTLSVYTHLETLDVVGALDALPVLSMGGDSKGSEVDAVNASATDNPASDPARKFAPAFAPEFVPACHNAALIGATATDKGADSADPATSRNANKDAGLRRVSSHVIDKKASGPGRVRTFDQVIMSHLL